MATPEQITERLQKRIQSQDDLEEVTRLWGGDILTDVEWTVEKTISMNVRRIVRDAIGKDLLNQLGMMLGLPSDQHAEHLRSLWTDRRSWAALIISVLALAASFVALYTKD